MSNLLKNTIKDLEEAENAIEYMTGAYIDGGISVCIDCDHEVGCASPECVLYGTIKSSLFRLRRLFKNEKKGFEVPMENREPVIAKSLEKTKYAQIKLSGGGSYVTPIDDLSPLLGELAEEEPGASWHVTLVEMTPEEYESLEEFNGH